MQVCPLVGEDPNLRQQDCSEGMKMLTSMGYGKSHCIHIYFNSILRLTNRFTESLEYYNRSNVIILEVILLQKSFSSIVTIKLCEESFHRALYTVQ